MLDIAPIPDAELEEVLAAALRSSSGRLSRSAECFMASAAARHLVDRLALAGLLVVRVPERRLT
jgi:hypothetical protein